MADPTNPQSAKRLAEGKDLGGRPTNYKPEYCDALIAFFDVEPYEDVEIKHYKDGKVSWIDTKRMQNKLPTLTGFAKTIGVSWRTLYDWLNKEHSSFQPEFSQAFTYAQELRKDFLIQNGLEGLIPPVTFKFVAVNMTDMRDKQQIEHTGEIKTGREPTEEEMAAFWAEHEAARAEGGADSATE